MIETRTACEISEKKKESTLRRKSFFGGTCGLVQYSSRTRTSLATFGLTTSKLVPANNLHSPAIWSRQFASD